MPTISCLQDKQLNVRKLAESVLEIIACHVPVDSIERLFVNLKPAVQQDMKPILARLKQSIPGDSVQLQEEDAATTVQEPPQGIDTLDHNEKEKEVEQENFKVQEAENQVAKEVTPVKQQAFATAEPSIVEEKAAVAAPIAAEPDLATISTQNLYALFSDSWATVLDNWHGEGTQVLEIINILKRSEIALTGTITPPPKY